ncbi:hypothetical protein EV175_003712 [Coemansia sp. RSA 1933]|nr:hypothetical protein EV175_003712 [Coemansia sp. RSA 1933]
MTQNIDWPQPPQMGQSPIRLCVPIWTYDDRYTGQPIVPHVILGPYNLMRKRAYLESQGISHVLCIRDPSEQRFLRAIDGTEVQFTFMDVPADVSKENIIPHFVQFNHTLAASIGEQRNVLVCCSDGIDKSSAFVAAYLMSTYGLKALDAVTFIQNHRYCATPSANGYRIKLIEYEPICAAQRDVGAGSLKNSRKRMDDDTGDGAQRGGAGDLPEDGRSRPIAPMPSSKRAR